MVKLTPVVERKVELAVLPEKPLMLTNKEKKEKNLSYWILAIYFSNLCR